MRYETVPCASAKGHALKRALLPMGSGIDTRSSVKCIVITSIVLFAVTVPCLLSISYDALPWAWSDPSSLIAYARHQRHSRCVSAHCLTVWAEDWRWAEPALQCLGHIVCYSVTITPTVHNCNIDGRRLLEGHPCAARRQRPVLSLERVHLACDGWYLANGWYPAGAGHNGMSGIRRPHLTSTRPRN